MHLKPIAALLLLSLVAAPGLAAAQAPTMNEPGEQRAVETSTVSAADAVATAEKLGKGKVTELTLDMEGATLGFRVTLAAADGTETNYLIDATTGASILVLEPKASGDNEQDAESADDNSGDATEN